MSSVMKFLGLQDLIGAFFLFFLFWLRLKEDYPSFSIFSILFFILFGIIGARFISFFLFPTFWFWLSFLGASLGFLFSYFKFNLRFFESLEAFFISFFPWIFSIFLFENTQLLDFRLFLYLLFFIFLALLFFYFEKKYKSFSWYRSGRIGFSGISVALLFFISRLILAFFYPDMLSFSGKSEKFLSGFLVCLLFGLMLFLARSED